MTCEVCERPLDECHCPRDASGAVRRPEDQSPRIRLERRRGRPVTIVGGLDPVASDRRGLLDALRKRAAAGGAVTDDGFEVQGDHRDVAAALLAEHGYRVRR